MNSLTSAVAAVVTDDAGRVLLCQQSQGHRRWGLPGGRIRREESPVHAAVRDIFEETGMAVEIVDLVGIYHLTGDGSGAGARNATGVRSATDRGEVPVQAGGRPGGGPARAPLPDVLVHVFRGRVHGAEATVNAPWRICRLAWHDPDDLPTPMTPTTRTAIADAGSGRSGVLRDVHRDVEPELPEATDPARTAAPTTATRTA